MRHVARERTLTLTLTLLSGWTSLYFPCFEQNLLIKVNIFVDSSLNLVNVLLFQRMHILTSYVYLHQGNVL